MAPTKEHRRTIVVTPGPDPTIRKKTKPRNPGDTTKINYLQETDVEPSQFVPNPVAIKKFKKEIKKNHVKTSKLKTIAQNARTCLHIGVKPIQPAAAITTTSTQATTEIIKEVKTTPPIKQPPNRTTKPNIRPEKIETSITTKTTIKSKPTEPRTSKPEPAVPKSTKTTITETTNLTKPTAAEKPKAKMNKLSKPTPGKDKPPISKPKSPNSTQSTPGKNRTPNLLIQIPPFVQQLIRMQRQEILDMKTWVKKIFKTQQKVIRIQKKPNIYIFRTQGVQYHISNDDIKLM